MCTCVTPSEPLVAGLCDATDRPAAARRVLPGACERRTAATALAAADGPGTGVGVAISTGGGDACDVLPIAPVKTAISTARPSAPIDPASSQDLSSEGGDGKCAARADACDESGIVEPRYTLAPRRAGLILKASARPGGARPSG